MSVSTIARTIGRGCLGAVILVLLIGVLGLVYFTLRPPFSLPETGHLQSDMDRELRLRPESPVAVLELDVIHDPRIFSETSPARFDPTRLTVTTAVPDGTETPVRVRIYPADAAPLTDMAPGVDGRSVQWLIDCDAVEARDCARSYVLVASADGLAADIQVSLSITAELPFPPHVPTPFLVSIGLDARQVRTEASGLALRTVQASGSISVTPDKPVAYQALSILAGATPLLTSDDMSAGGLALELTVSRDAEGIPVGLLAPPPVRAALIAKAGGAVVVDVGVRPGNPTTVSLPATSAEYLLVISWHDRAAQAYRVDWRVEAGTVSDESGPAVEVRETSGAESVAQTTTSGETQMVVGASRPALEFGVGVDLGEVEAAHLTSAAGVLRLELELDPEASPGPLILLLSRSEYSGDEAVPVTLRPGEPVQIALDAVADCIDRRCPPWRGRLQTPGQSRGPTEESVTIRWRAAFDLWRLDPEGDAPSFYELDQ
jgi:hypothetical protein